MGTRAILRWPDPRLSQYCAPVTPGEELTALIADLFETMYTAPGRGLAAPQIGVLKRVFVTDTTWKDGPRSPIAFLNPEITDSAAQTAEHSEGCLSIPGVSVQVERPAWVEMSWLDTAGTAHRRRFEGFDAACVQHELDHLDGIVTFDRIGSLPRAAAEAAYAQALA